jgi:hypothetical protein
VYVFVTISKKAATPRNSLTLMPLRESKLRSIHRDVLNLCVFCVIWKYLKKNFFLELFHWMKSICDSCPIIEWKRNEPYLPTKTPKNYQSKMESSRSNNDSQSQIDFIQWNSSKKKFFFKYFQITQKTQRFRTIGQLILDAEFRLDDFRYQNYTWIFMKVITV